MTVIAHSALDRAAMAVFEHKPTTGRRRLTDDTATAREIAEVVLEAADYAGAIEDRDHYRTVLSGLLIYARGNPHLLDKIHTALDSPPSSGQSDA